MDPDFYLPYNEMFGKGVRYNQMGKFATRNFHLYLRILLDVLIDFKKNHIYSHLQTQVHSKTQKYIFDS